MSSWRSSAPVVHCVSACRQASFHRNERHAFHLNGLLTESPRMTMYLIMLSNVRWECRHDHAGGAGGDRELPSITAAIACSLDQPFHPTRQRPPLRPAVTIL